MQNQAAKPVVDSRNLADYKIPRVVANKLAEDGKLREYMTNVCGRTPPDFIRLKHVDFVALDSAVREQSGGAKSGSSVLWNYLPIKSERDK